MKAMSIVTPGSIGGLWCAIVTWLSGLSAANCAIAGSPPAR